jgi:chromosomal replication initiation ATPase DnaA
MHIVQQKAFSFAGSNAYDPDEFIESSSNSLAYKTINNWPNIWGVSPYPKALIIQGPKASGKTFLAKKWAIKSDALFIKKMHEMTESIIEHHSAFIIDDIDSGWVEEKLFHIFNLISEYKKYLLITCQTLPKIALPDLASRLKSVNHINIEHPDDEMMTMLIFKLFSNYSVVINVEVVNFLIKVLPREFPAIIDAVNIINDFALENKRKITIPLVKTALN